MATIFEQLRDHQAFRFPLAPEPGSVDTGSV